MSESTLKAAVLKALRAIPRIKVLRMQSGTRSGGRMHLCEPGTPDLQVLLDRGRTLWLELKRPDGKGKVREAQAKWHADVEPLQHRVVIVESVQDAISAVLEERQR